MGMSLNHPPGLLGARVSTPPRRPDACTSTRRRQGLTGDRHAPFLSGHGVDHRHDRAADRRGQVGPRVDDALQVGVDLRSDGQIMGKLGSDHAKRARIKGFSRGGVLNSCQAGRKIGYRLVIPLSASTASPPVLPNAMGVDDGRGRGFASINAYSNSRPDPNQGSSRSSTGPHRVHESTGVEDGMSEK